MPSGSRRIAKFPSLAGAALAFMLASGPARAQDAIPPETIPQANPEDLELRADKQIVPAADQPPPGQSAGQVDKKDAKKPKTKKAVGKLPAVQPYRGAQRLGLRGGPTELDPTKAGLRGEPADLEPTKADPPGEAAPTPGPATAAIPTPPPARKIAADDKPFDPVGLRIGDLGLKPYIEEDGGWASNPGLVPGPPKGSAFETTEVGASLQSDWSRSDLHGELKAGYTDYFSEPLLSAPYGSATLDGRYDVSKDLSFDGEGRFNLSQEPLTTLGLTPATSGVVTQTAVTSYGATVGGAQKFGDLTLALHGTYDRLTYQNVVLPGVGDLALDDYNDWGLLARASYRLSEAVSPFLELGVDKRLYDSVTDANGYERDSNGATAKIGATLAFSKMLTGEASVGYGAREYQDPRLPNASAPLINGSLIWSPTPLTTITLKAQSALADAVLAGASADVTHNYTIDISHALTRAITLGVSAGYATDRYIGASLRDSTTTLALKGEYHLSRDVVLKASASRQQFVSSAQNSNYVADVFMLGLRVQR